MSTQRYSVTQVPIEVLLSWVKSGEIAIPEIQRPFVWNAVKVRNFLDSLYRRYPTGYLIAWKNPDVRLKDGTMSAGKRILIDGQQRVTALMAAILGQEVTDKDYEKVRIRIAFHPVHQKFEVCNSAIAKDPAWIPDVSVVFDANAGLFSLVSSYCQRNPAVNMDQIFASIESLRGMVHNQVGIIELNSDLDIETVTEIFVRVNSEGVTLNQADFAMSKIAANDACGGSNLRKAIDYFCHAAVKPEFISQVRKDQEFASSEFFHPMVWLQDEKDDLYDPSYTDMLRVAFSSEFERGRLEDLVALLSGRNFETREYEERIAEESFARLKRGILSFMNENNFKQLVMIIRSAGFVDASMIGSQNTLNFAYILYLLLKKRGLPPADIERHVRRWFVMSVLTGRYSSVPESAFDYDIRRIDDLGIESYSRTVIGGELSDSFWEVSLPQAMNTSAASSPYFRVFEAAQVKANDLGFLSRDITVRELIEVKSNVHHVFPKECLKKEGMSVAQYNQIANYVVAQSEINIAIGAKEPRVYFSQLFEQCNGGRKHYGNITDMNELLRNLEMHCIPGGIEAMTVQDYPAFLEERRKLMAAKMKRYFYSL